jgi:hypothetical protein
MGSVPVGQAIIVMTATGWLQRHDRRFPCNRLVRIMPATSKHRMDEQRGTQQVTENSTHYLILSVGQTFLPAFGINLTQTFDNLIPQSE